MLKQIAVEFFKRYWWVSVVIVASGVCGFEVCSCTHSVNAPIDRTEEIQKIQSAYDKYVTELKEAIEDERAAHAINVSRLEQELTSIEGQYAESLKSLEARKTAVARNIEEKYKDDPDGLTQKFSEVTKIPIWKEPLR